MRTARRASGITAALLLSVAWGCAPLGRYVARRGSDLKDCFEATIGFGMPAYLRVKATDLAVVGAGYAGVSHYGWQAFDPAEPVPEGDSLGYLEAGVPLLWNYERVTAWPPYGDTRRLTDRLEIETYGPCITRREYHGAPLPLGRDLASRGWVSLSATVLMSLQLGLNPVEFTDFTLGWFGLDLLSDDARRRAPRADEKKGREP